MAASHQSKKGRREKHSSVSWGCIKLVFGIIYLLSGIVEAVLGQIIPLYFVIGVGLLVWWFAKDRKEKGCKEKTSQEGFSVAEQKPKEDRNTNLPPTKFDSPKASPASPKYETEATRIAKEAASKYEHIKIRLVGVTFRNEDGKSRQSILRHIRFRDPPFDKEVEMGMYQYEYESEPAVSVSINDMCIGNIPKEKAPFFVENWDRLCGITHIEVIGGGASSDGERLNYGAEIIIKLKKQV